MAASGGAYSHMWTVMNAEFTALKWYHDWGLFAQKTKGEGVNPRLQKPRKTCGTNLMRLLRRE